MADAFGMRGIADWLGLAAAPAFAVMAVVSGVGDEGRSALCTVAGGPAAWDGMAFMYLLMSLIHLPPWVRALSGRAAQPRWSHVSARPPGCDGGGPPDDSRGSTSPGFGTIAACEGGRRRRGATTCPRSDGCSGSGSAR